MNFKRQPHIVNNKRLTVLLIGDSLGILKRIAFALQRLGHSVIWAKCGQTGLRVAEGEAPNLIISEIDLPDISGFEICRMIKSSFYFEIPVVLVGRSSEEENDSPQAFKAGADDYFASFSNSQFVLAKLDRLAQRNCTTAHDKEIAATAGLSRVTHTLPGLDVSSEIRFE